MGDVIREKRTMTSRDNTGEAIVGMVGDGEVVWCGAEEIIEDRNPRMSGRQKGDDRAEVMDGRE